MCESTSMVVRYTGKQPLWKEGQCDWRLPTRVDKRRTIASLYFHFLPIIFGAGCSGEVKDGISIGVHFYKYLKYGKINHGAASSNNQNGTDQRKD